MVSIELGYVVHNVVISSAYRPPKTGVAMSHQLIKHIADIRAKANLFLLFGDFNYPDVDWERPWFTKCDELGNVFQPAVDELCLLQLVGEPTH